jgi:hypothetical protein
VAARAISPRSWPALGQHGLGEERRTEVPLTPAMIGNLALEASSRDTTICELSSDLVLDVTRKQLVQRVLEGD